MKKVIWGIIITAGLTCVACKESKSEVSEGSSPREAQESLVQPERVYTNSEGATIHIVYFAKGDEVAVKLTQGGKTYELIAKGTNEKGNPTFTNENLIWEMLEDGQSGKLSQPNQKPIIYKEERR